MDKSKRKLNIASVLLFVVLIIPFLSISGIKNTISEGIYQIWQLGSVCVLALIFLFKHSRARLGWAIGLFAAYQSVILASSVFNNGINPGIITVIVALLLIFALLQTDSYYEIICAVSVIVVLSLFINFPVMLQNRGAVNAEFFIGGKNSLGIFLIPGIFMLIINSLERISRTGKFTLIAIALSLLTVLIGSSGTGIIVALCATLFLLLAIKFKPQKTIYLGVIFAVYALFLLFPEDFLLTEHWLEFTDMLGKDGTLTGRSTIWDISKALIRENWLFGAGRGVTLSYVNTWGVHQTISEAHNFILEILLEGGALALTLFGILFFRTVRRLDMKDPRHKTVFIALCVLLINGLTESTINGFLVVMLLSIACRYANEPKNDAVGCRKKDKKWISDSKN